MRRDHAQISKSAKEQPGLRGEELLSDRQNGIGLYGANRFLAMSNNRNIFNNLKPSFSIRVILMRLKLILSSMLLLALTSAAVADEVDDHISDLTDEDPGVRWRAAFVLGKIGDPQAVDPLILALNDSDGDVRSVAAWALGKMEDLKAVDPLILSLNDSDKIVRKEAARALGEIGDPRAVDP